MITERVAEFWIVGILRIGDLCPVRRFATDKAEEVPGKSFFPHLCQTGA